MTKCTVSSYPFGFETVESLHQEVIANTIDCTSAISYHEYNSVLDYSEDIYIQPLRLRPVGRIV